jgi:hypothetical protein
MQEDYRAIYKHGFLNLLVLAFSSFCCFLLLAFYYMFMKLTRNFKILVITILLSIIIYLTIAPRYYCENFKKGLKDSYDKDVYC